MSTPATIRLLEALFLLPHANLIRDIDVRADEVRFTWRGTRFRVSNAGAPFVEEVRGAFLSGGDLSILMEHAITMALGRVEEREAKPVMPPMTVGATFS